MQDSFISISDIKSELVCINNLGVDLARNLSSLSQKIRYIIARIKSCEDIESAEEYFVLLDEIQGNLAVLVFRDEIGVPDRLHKFIRDFDNMERSKEYLFSDIKGGCYKF